MYYWKNGTKYYKVQFQQNLFGATDVVCSWGKSGTNNGGYKIISCNNNHDIELAINRIKKRRKYRGYIIVDNNCCNQSMTTNPSNNQLSIEGALALIRQFPEYKILEEYQRPEAYNADDNCQKFIGIFVDVETTGLDSKTDKIIELGMVKFEYSEDGRIFRIIDEFNSYNDPGIPILEKITELTGITNEMVADNYIMQDEVRI
jgi:DNA polymerase III subunit epsilon